MKEEFDLENEKRAMPYQVPADFFENITQATLQEAKRREALANAAPKTNWGRSVWAIAASLALLLVAGYYLLREPQAVQPAIVRTESKPAPASTPVVNLEPVTTQPVATQKQIAHIKGEAEPRTKNKKQNILISPKPTAKPGQPESLDRFLAALTDQELTELAAMAATETYVYEESLQ